MTQLDTAFNYHHFASHRTLAATGLMQHFEITTKVGFHTDGHSLDPQHLRSAVETTVRELGREPDTVLLHNPERDPEAVTPACGELLRMRDMGLFRSWGISSWDPRGLVDHPWVNNAPDVLMIRAGLAVPVHVLDAGEKLAASTGAQQLRGMSPFGGFATADVWSRFDARVFLADGPAAGGLQAVFAAAFALPPVTQIAVGTSSPEHLAELVRASRFSVNTAKVDEYRRLLAERATVTHKPDPKGSTSAAVLG
ncbi:aldo/keto reductase [Streptomyces sp. NPDC002044]|uniref:aldo/keto reductase n=1 Tax=Streptomyces sp. NPDC002044 TaxID=3154662 RepID=UPI0033303595